MCSYQSANYTVAVQPEGEIGGTITVGPLPYNTSQTGQTGPVELEVTGLETNKMYSVTVTLLTSTGTANSTAYFGMSHALSLPYTPYSTRRTV